MMASQLSACCFYLITRAASRRFRLARVIGDAGGRTQARVDALRPLLLLHSFRFVGLAFLVIKQSENAPAVFTEALELANDFAKASKSAATQRAYSSDNLAWDGPGRLSSLRRFP
jgi:hypothetical protein